MSGRLTEWFPPHVKPVRVGVYEVVDSDGELGWYAFWNGKKFGYRCWKSPQSAFYRRHESTWQPNFAKWRGLADNPEA